MSNDHFIKTLDRLFEVSLSVTDKDIQSEIERIKTLPDKSFSAYFIALKPCGFRPFMKINAHKGVNSVKYVDLLSHKIYSDALICVGFNVCTALQISAQRFSLDLLNADYSYLNGLNRFRLFLILCVLTYMATPMQDLDVYFIVYCTTINIPCRPRINALMDRYITTGDIEYKDVATNILVYTDKPQDADLIHKMFNSYRAYRKGYVEIPNLFELCSYDRTITEGYDIKCFNRTYELASLPHRHDLRELEDIEIDIAYGCIGLYSNTLWEIYSKVLIEFHKHIYKKEIDVEKLHKLIMFDEELTPYERRYAIIFHRANIKSYILKGGFGDREDAVAFEDIIPDSQEKGIIAYSRI